MASDDLSQSIAGLVADFQSLPPEKKKTFTEADVGTKFVLPLLEKLGWDIHNIDEVREQHRTLTGPSDYDLLINKRNKIVVEIKSFSESLDGFYSHKGKTETFPEQAIRYAWHLKLDWAVLTNFQEVRLYYTRVKNPSDGLIFKIRVDEFTIRLDELLLISKEKVAVGELDAFELRREREPVDKEVLNDLNEIRRDLQKSIDENNNVPETNLREIVQVIMDRLLVIRVAEDRGLVGSDMILKEMHSWQDRGLGSSFMKRLKILFSEFEEEYDTNLFQDGLVDSLKIDNDVIVKTIEILYRYDFSLIDSDVLGSIYEDYITIALMETDQGDLQIVDDNEKRKKLGVYYTPRHLVEHILEKTLGEKLKYCTTPDDVSKIKVLDPACGSGSFLIKAFDLILKWYREYNQQEEDKKKGQLESTFNLVTNPEARILKDNLFGVDIDHQAAEIAAVNLMLKAIRKGEKLKPILGHNIRVGNSLVNGKEEKFEELKEGIKTDLRVFDWAVQFPNTKFDIVVGNPPYFKVREKNPIRISSDFEKVKSGPVNVAMMFINKSIDMLNDTGRLGLVIPKMCSYTKGWTATRKQIFENLKLNNIIDCEEAFENVLLEQILLIGEKSSENKESNSYEVGFAEPDVVNTTAKLAQKLAIDNNLIFLESNSLAYQIREKMLDNSKQFLGEMLPNEIILGEGIQSKKCWTETKPKNAIKMLGGEDISRYLVKDRLYFDKNNREVKNYQKEIRALNVPHVVCQRIIAHVRHPVPHIILMCGFESKGAFAFNTVVHILVDEKKHNPFFILGFLNSRAVSYYAYKFIYCNAIRSMDLYEDYLSRIPIPNLNAAQQTKISDLVKKQLKHISNELRIKPKIKNYLIEKTMGSFTLLDYIRELDGKDKIIKDNKTGGELIDYSLEFDDEWIIFKVDYKLTKSKIFRDKELFRIHPNKVLGHYILHSLRTGKPGKKEKYHKLFEQLTAISTTAYGDGLSEHEIKLHQMLDPYIKDLNKFLSWQKTFIDLDLEIDNIIFETFGLDSKEVDFIMANSRPLKWINY